MHIGCRDRRSRGDWCCRRWLDHRAGRGVGFRLLMVVMLASNRDGSADRQNRR
jgi:hypothetical protein